MLLNWTKETWWPLKFECAISAFLLLSAGRWIEELLFSVVWYYSPDSRVWLFSMVEFSALQNFKAKYTDWSAWKIQGSIFSHNYDLSISYPLFIFLLKKLVENKLYMCWTEILSFFGSFSLCPEPQTKVRTVFIFIYTCKLVRLHSCIWIDWIPTKSVEHFCPLMNGKANLF